MPIVTCPDCDAPQEVDDPTSDTTFVCARCDHTWTTGVKVVAVEAEAFVQPEADVDGTAVAILLQAETEPIPTALPIAEAPTSVSVGAGWGNPVQVEQSRPLARRAKPASVEATTIASQIPAASAVSDGTIISPGYTPHPQPSGHSVPFVISSVTGLFLAGLVVYLMSRSASKSSIALAPASATIPLVTAPKPISPPVSHSLDEIKADLASNQPQVVAAAADRLAAGGPANSVALPNLLMAMITAKEENRPQLIAAARELGTPNIQDEHLVHKILQTPDDNLRRYACWVYAHYLKASPDALPDLVREAKGSDAERRTEAVLALVRYGPECKAAALRVLLNLENDPMVRDQARNLRESFSFGPSDRTLLTEILYDKRASKDERLFVAHKLAALHLSPDQRVSIWQPMLKEKDVEIRALSAANLRQCPAAHGDLAFLAQKDPSPKVRKATLTSLLTIAESSDAKVMMQIAVSDSDNELRQTARTYLYKADLAVLKRDELLLLLGLNDPALRLPVVSRLLEGGFAERRDLPTLLRFLKDGDESLHRKVFAFIKQIGPQAADSLPALVNFIRLSEPSAAIKCEAVKLLPMYKELGMKALLDFLGSKTDEEVLRQVIISLDPFIAALRELDKTKDYPYLTRCLFSILDIGGACATEAASLLVKLHDESLADKLLDRLWVGRVRPGVQERYSLGTRQATVRAFAKFDFTGMTKINPERVIRSLSYVKDDPETKADLRNDIDVAVNTIKEWEQKDKLRK